MNWEHDSREIAINTLDFYWDLETWLFLPSPPHSFSTGGVLQLVIEQGSTKYRDTWVFQGRDTITQSHPHCIIRIYVSFLDLLCLS